MVKVVLYIQMEMSMRVTGIMIKQKVMAYILIWMEHNIKVLGKMINSMVKGKKRGQMVLVMREIIFLVKNMERELSYGLMVPYILVNSTTIILKVLANINGQMGDHSMETGKIIKCMGKEFLIGLMEGSMMVNILKIRNRDLEHSIGLQEENM